MSKHVVTLPALPPAPPAFNYSEMDPDQAAVLRAQADRICKLKRTCTAAVIEIGRELIDVKARLKHGQFERWIEAECGFTRRTADNYMAAAKFAEDQEDKSEIISDLPPALVYQLASKSTPSEIVSDVLHRAANGEVVKEVEVKAKIRQTKQQKSPGSGKLPKPDLNQVMTPEPEVVAAPPQPEHPGPSSGQAQPEQPGPAPLPSLDEMATMPERPWDDETFDWMRRRLAVAMGILIETPRWALGALKCGRLIRALPADALYSKAEIDQVIKDLQELNRDMAPRRGAMRKAKAQAKAAMLPQKTTETAVETETIPTQAHAQEKSGSTLEWVEALGEKGCHLADGTDDSAYAVVPHTINGEVTHYTVYFKPSSTYNWDNAKVIDRALALDAAKALAQHHHADKAKAEAV